ncbi:endonuclease/exonuclease/phosphatase family protein [Lelliottia wanjuensis]|jgi:endonuclease/exonuclease/phosphatase family metal-dependent hydrolase|uniref:endonuclease/exonuclease/phosphatase family protein n=1 Tax=Lelliottia wanjuensis TaxID=3050585 RepID=UPI00249E15EE|nr:MULTISPECIES: endonuclease/exonuclease/phosphatase family protein [unclassified Lelliottia]MDI3359546.1 endonuclease/exonuclease/phosphatase family protein [Lelliottia sp. V89_13]MDK9550428.1 endonuclease/exonuclease/phosphatase family protein [Lelliottia sp. V89_5]MDK9586105.1 endonuclease/exonuclease/phosphatase family protein [Lelliottia sp. V86_10]MDK9596021.1 endonuclease/exonuclease/phosphatase family protein [Lelliottia sp. V89_10]MDK9606524.1 endonuclease/exonuclease/phosphatase fam
MTQKTRHFSLKILTINTHKGFTAFNRRFILPELRDAVRTVGADIVCLQEVMGAHDIHPLHVENWPDTSHYEFLADTMWSDYAYGRNAVYPEGHHGNAVLSRFPIEHYENHDVSVGESEKRGLLYCRITPPDLAFPVHVGCVHLGLREAHRQAQLAMMARWVNSLPENDPVVIAGDFNDWQQRASRPLKADAGLDEIFTRAHGRPARTFPVSFPLLRLDRIYVKNAHASQPSALALKSWRHLSDHAPLSAEIHL